MQRTIVGYAVNLIAALLLVVALSIACDGLPVSAPSQVATPSAPAQATAYPVPGTQVVGPSGTATPYPLSESTPLTTSPTPYPAPASSPEAYPSPTTRK